MSLIADGCYQGFFDSIEDCFKHPETFMILDSPSGTGKTLAGVAASQHFSDVTLVTEVIHMIWPDSVRDQAIYRDLTATLHHRFFESIRKINFSLFPVDCDLDKIWDATLKDIFPGHPNWRDFEDSGKRLFLIIDEVPQDPFSAGLVGKLRDLLKRLHNVRLCLAGTNSKTANMVGISQGAASATETRSGGSPWAIIVTRFPQFELRRSRLRKDWKEIVSNDKMKLVVASIKSSIDNGGNARTIEIAIVSATTMIKMGCVEDEARCVDEWQTILATAVMKSKFGKKSYTEMSKGVVGQLNLLLGASAEPHISDVLLSHHFAARAIPDGGASSSSKHGASFADIGGWLMLAPDNERALGNSLIFVAGPFQQQLLSSVIPPNGTTLWQRTVFRPPESDCLLYLAAARRNGYFSTELVNYRAFEVVKAMWRSHSAGMVNYQNPSAILNTGTLMEVLVAAAVPNAAAAAENSVILRRFPSYICKLCKELGTPAHNLEIHMDSPGYPKLKAISIPRIILPCQTILPILTQTVGCLSRQPNKYRFDLLLRVPSAVGGNVTKISLGAKVREKLSVSEIALAARTLLYKDCEVGVLVLSHCCQFWGETAHNVRKRADLKKCLTSALGRTIGVVFLLKCDGSLATINIDACDGYLFIIQVPEASLCDH